ncbi:MAG TPA: hypothetical protein PK926_06720 [Spirochaetota bacterium]|nr:hypothetical protein [Spirochaetota bacterium]HPI89603.1 hypothetical protein [Spirochaetota bacterium]HPR48062.1 hypothetical protein [Spirochaetota bacterium]
MEDESKTEFTVSYSEKYNIIKIYALRICLIIDDYEKEALKIIRIFRQNSIDTDEARKKLQSITAKTTHLLSKLYIEQYYNTGDDEIFDRAMMLDENIHLERYSILDLTNNEQCENLQKFDQGLLVPYEGLFILFSGNDSPSTVKKIKILYRDPESVNKVNKKLELGRQILNVDQVTLGKKYYQGLCMRTHYH